MQRSVQACRLCMQRRPSLFQRIQKSSSFTDHLVVSEEVKSALSTNRPVVALETTIITHGMPYPQNIRMATEVEDLVRDHGSTPATIGIVGGKVHVGLSRSELEFLADPSTKSIKTSRRDLAYIVSQKLHGGTTVSGTMVVAQMAGIPIFVTGGIGGVHRGGESSLDVSADLRELGRTPVTVISSGVKSILDIGRTLEYLETEGVCVATFGQSHEFPAFFCRKSGYTAPYRTETPLEAAKLIASNRQLGLQSGTLIAVPIPEQFDTLGQEIETVIQAVVAEALQSGIQGKDITPYILGKVNELTGGKSLEANIHLVKNNAVVGSQIAVELARIQQTETGPQANNDKQFRSPSLNIGKTLEKDSSSKGKKVRNKAVVESQLAVQLAQLQQTGKGSNTNDDKQFKSASFSISKTREKDSSSKGKKVRNNSVVGSQIAVELARLQQTETGQHRNNDKQFKSASFSVSKTKENKASTNSKKVTVIGGSIVDFYANLMSESFQVNGATYPGKVKQSFGGVGRNIADGLCRLGVETCFISAIGCDSHQAAFETYCNHMDLSAVQRLEGHSTATYCAVLGNEGELLFGIGDMEIHKQITPDLISKYEKELSESSLVCVDGNVTETTIEYVCQFCQQNQVPVLFDPADLHKATKPFLTSAHKALVYTTPNFNELRMMAGHLSGREISLKVTADDLDHDDCLHECVELLNVVCNHVPVILVTLGRHGVVLCHHGDSRSRPYQIKREGDVIMEHYPAMPQSDNPVPIVSVSGAGDCMIAAMVSYILSDHSLEESVKAGLLAAQISLQSAQAVPSTLTAQAIHMDNVLKLMNVQLNRIK